MAHVLALKYLRENDHSEIFNLGSGSGYSVKQIIDTARNVTGVNIKTVIGENRAGDPPTLIASSEKARKILGWEPKYDNIEKIISTAWNWHKNLYNQKGGK
jgi:UDP-glucose 4-epimerase